MKLVRSIRVDVPELPRVPGLNYVVLITDTFDNSAQVTALFADWSDANSFADTLTGSGDLESTQSVVFMNVNSSRVETPDWSLEN